MPALSEVTRPLTLQEPLAGIEAPADKVTVEAPGMAVNVPPQLLTLPEGRQGWRPPRQGAMCR